MRKMFGFRVKLLFTVFMIVMLAVCTIDTGIVSAADEPANAPIGSGGETEGNVTLNPGYIKGEISIGDTSKNTVEMTQVQIYATSEDAIGNDLRADLYLNKADNDDMGNYKLTVHIPDETWKKDGSQDYRVSCVVRFNRDKYQYVIFKSQHVDVPYGDDAKIVNFKMTPGYISGELVSTCEFKGGWIKGTVGDRYNDDPNYNEVRILMEPVEGDPHRMKFHFPVNPCNNLKISGQYTLTNGWAFGLEEKIIEKIDAGEEVDPGWKAEQCNGTACAKNLKGEIAVEGAGEDFVVDHHEVHLLGATQREQTTSTGNYELNGLRNGVHQLYVGSFFNKYSSSGYEDILYQPFADYDDNKDYNEGGKYYNFIRTDIDCGDTVKNVISRAAFVSGKISFKKDATVVAFKEDQSSDNPMPGLTYCLIWGHGINGATGSVNGDRNGWAQHRVDKDTGKYKMLLTKGDWNVYCNRFDFCPKKEVDLCGNGNLRYLNTNMYMYDYTRSSLYGHKASISLDAGETLAPYDIEYETGSATIKFYINGGGQLSEPYVYARNITKDGNDVIQQIVEVNGWGKPLKGQYSNEGEVTIIGTPGKYIIQARAMVNGVQTSFGEEVIYIVAGTCRTFEFGAPTLTIDEQSSALQTCGGEITLSGKATDNNQVTGITINGEPVNFTSTLNSANPNEVSFAKTLGLQDGPNKIEIIVTNSYGKTITDSRTVYNYTAGVFTVENEDGIVKVDFLYDGGAYEGELGIFSLNGMDTFEPGSPEFIAEAIRRVMSDSENGHIVLQDKVQGARFNEYLGTSKDNHNKGPYLGAKSFNMRPGDKFATVMIPNGTFEEFAQDPATTNARKIPLFSLASSNPEDGMYYGQIAGIPLEGLDNSLIDAIAYEDIAAPSSDRDYNDLIVQIRGMSVCSPTLDAVIEKDWRPADGSDDVTSHLNIPKPDENTLWVTVTLKSPADLLVYDPEGRVIGKDGGQIPGATFEWDENGHQVVTLPALEDGEYSIVLRAIGEGGECHLEVKGFQGGEEISTREIPLNIEPHQVLKTILPVSEFVESQTVTFDTPALPVAKDGTVLAFDFDGDSDIDDTDIERVSGKWGVCEGNSEYDAFYDLDDDGCIGFYDIMSVANSWHTDK